MPSVAYACAIRVPNSAGSVVVTAGGYLDAKLSDMELTGDVAVVLVRHGETEWSSSGDTRRTPTSRSRRTAATRRARLPTRLEGIDFSLVLTSPRQRARDDVRVRGLEPRAEITDDLAEWNYGDYEGRTTEAIRAEVPGWTIFRDGAPGGETADEVEGARRSCARAARPRPEVSSRCSRTDTSSACSARAGSVSPRRPARGSGSTPRPSAVWVTNASNASCGSGTR